jgi:hypothetical protein
MHKRRTPCGWPLRELAAEEPAVTAAWGLLDLVHRRRIGPHIRSCWWAWRCGISLVGMASGGRRR